MRRMGDKVFFFFYLKFFFLFEVAARQAAIEAGVQVVPGTNHPVTSADEVMDFVKQYGTPIIVKAAYGGGGRGMRKVEREDDVRKDFFN